MPPLFFMALSFMLNRFTRSPSPISPHHRTAPTAGQAAKRHFLGPAYPVKPETCRPGRVKSGRTAADINRTCLCGRATCPEKDFPVTAAEPIPLRTDAFCGDEASMIEDRAVTLLDECEGTSSRSGGRATLRFELDIAGERFDFGVHAVRGQVRLSDIVPLARALSERLCRATLQKLHAEDGDVPCRRGCGACCSYLVPLSVAEVFRLREDISALPTDKSKAILNACLSAAGRILEERPDSPAAFEPCQTNAARQNERMSKWYAGLRLPCPFLSDEACTCYETRPLACREHFVTSPAALCVAGATPEPSVVPMPLSVLECMGKLCAELEQREVEAVILPLALPWALKNHERSGRTWPTGMIVERFIEILKAAAAKTRTPDEVHV